MKLFLLYVDRTSISEFWVFVFMCLFHVLNLFKCF